MDVRQSSEAWLEQIRELRWNAQTVSVTILLGLAIVAVLLVQNPRVPEIQDDLFAGRRLSNTELQRIEAALGKAELNSYSAENGTIRVPSSQRSKYYAAIQDAGCLPSTFHGPTRQAIKAASTFETSRASQQRLHHAHEQEARLAICELGGVEDAFVFFDEDTDRTLQRNKHVTAVVGVRTSPKQPLDLQSFQVIRDMLLGFKVDLTPEDITITDLTARRAFRGSLDHSDSAGVRSLAQQGLEREWKQRIENALSFITDTQVNVRVVPEPESATVAKSVFASIAIPSTYLTQQGPVAASAEYHKLAKSTREKIQSALHPILPAANESPEEAVKVTVFDVVDPARQPTSNFATTAFVGVLAIACALSAVFLFHSVGQPRDPKAEHQLRVYPEEGPVTDAATPDPRRHDAPVEESIEPDDQAAALRAFVAEDPDAAAKSLSEFIDRAS